MHMWLTIKSQEFFIKALKYFKKLKKCMENKPYIARTEKIDIVII